MSTFTVKVAIEHDGRSLPGFPIIRRLEDTGNESKIIDQRWPDADIQEPLGLGSALSPIGALVFEKQADIEFGVYSGLKVIRILPGGCAVLMASKGIGYSPTANGRVQGVA